MGKGDKFMALNALLKGTKLPVLFVGSGLSRRYLDTPDWEGLLKSVYAVIGKSEMDYKALKSKIKNTPENRDKSDGQLNALIASALEEEFNEVYFNSDLLQKSPEWMENETSPFKNCIANLVSTKEIKHEKIVEIEELQKLRGKISAIVTTNYDSLLENIFGFHKESVFIGQSQMFSPTSVEIEELYKIHGCVTQPNKIVITSQDYERYKDFAKLFSAKLLTLISENPVIFIGYQIGDPNVQQTLVDLVSCLSEEQIENLQNHFYIVEYSPNEQNLIENKFYFQAKSYEGKEITFPISVLSTDNYLELYKKLGTLTPAMNLNIVKQVKRLVKDIVVESTSTVPTDNAIITVLLEDISQLDSLSKDQKLAIAIGNVSDIKDYGYGLKPLFEVFEDILLDNKNIDAEKILRGTYENHYLKIKQNLPIYKYVSKASLESLQECERVQNYINNHDSLNSYLNTHLIREVERAPEGDKLSDITEYYNYSTRRRYLWIFKNVERLDIKELKAFILGELAHYHLFESNERGLFNRLISMYDFIKYK